MLAILINGILLHSRNGSDIINKVIVKDFQITISIQNLSDMGEILHAQFANSYGSYYKAQ